MSSIKVFSFIFSLLIAFYSHCQNMQLSSLAEISVVVADPGTKELFEAFGHPAIRVNDPLNNIDLAFNYGIFDFDQPYFYLNFTRGYLNYMVAAWPYSSFAASYIVEDRSLKEYILNLSHQQKQQIFDFLVENIKPENRHYFYDYFYDNCSTRIWEVFEKTLGDSLHFNENYIQPNHSFRTLVDSLTVHKPWGDFGIDLCLGLPMDKKLNAYEYMFLPEFLGRSLNQATVTINGVNHSFVKESKILFQSKSGDIESGIFTPNFLFWVIFILVLFITIAGILKKQKMVILDLAIFGSAGLIGLLLLLLWIATDHTAAANNINIIWANPLYLLGIYFLLKRKSNKRTGNFFLAIGIILLLFIVTWPINPQGINVAIIPIALSLSLRAFYIAYSGKANPAWF